jgi:uncharacterized SAM-binding protein YcdF (DUF218 family)
MAKVVLSLGGNINRLDTSIELVKQNPGSYLFISSESDPAACLQKVHDAGLDPTRVFLNYYAWDTVTNFTNTKRPLSTLNPDEILVVTDGYHMLRAMTIGRIIYFGSNVKLTEHPSSPKDHSEPLAEVITDAIRALISRFLGMTIFSQNVYDDRIPYYYDCYYVARTLQGG